MDKQLVNPSGAWLVSSSGKRYIHNGVVTTPLPNVAPAVSFTASTLTPAAGGSVTLTATATDSDGFITEVVFYDGSIKLATLTAAPFTYTTTFATGTHPLKATAKDNAGAITTTPTQNLVAAASNVAPTVSLAVSSSTVALNGSVTFTATAADSDGSIANVEFLRNGSVVSNDAIAPYTYVYSAGAVGTYTFTARATDNKGLATTSSPVTLTVTGATNIPPTVSLQTPTGTLQVGTAIPLTATAADADGSIGKVEFFDGATKIGEDTTSPYAVSWNPTTAGNHTLTAVATDNLTAQTTSSAVNVTVTAGSTNQSPTTTITLEKKYGLLNEDVVANITATDPDGTVTLTELLREGTAIGSDATAPYQIRVSQNATGTFNMQSRATDDKGLQASSTASPYRVYSKALTSSRLTDGGYYDDTEDTGTTLTTAVSGDKLYFTLLPLGGSDGQRADLVLPDNSSPGIIDFLTPYLNQEFVYVLKSTGVAYKGTFLNSNVSLTIL